jgi:hypothetical protein
MSSLVPDQVLRALQPGALSAPELVSVLHVSQATISRLLAPLVRDRRVLKMGAARGVRYGMRRAIADIGSAWPLYQIDVRGVPAQIVMLDALAGNQFYVEAQADVQLRALRGLTSGLPYYLQDQRPNGFMGRNVPHRYPDLQLPDRLDYWSDDHYLSYLTRHGSDAVSDLVLGDAALNELLAARRSPILIADNEREHRYAQLADAAMHGGLPGSSAHGEQPKFAALIATEDGPQHVLVKFSPPVSTPVGQRWSDLLLAEHHAHRVINAQGNEPASAQGLRACESEVVMGGGRTFLEVRRFDRHGATGRVGVTSLFAIDNERYGKLDNWIAAAQRLFNDGCIASDDLRRLRLASAFGALIGNTDRHFGNVAFFDRYDGRFELAPIYDMLPMLFAPQHDHLVERTFSAPHATADTMQVWDHARTMAISYWQTLAEDRRVSVGFRGVAANCVAACQTV